MQRFSSPALASAPLFGDMPGSAAGDAYAQALDRIGGVCGTGGSIAVTSAGPGEGKSVTAANFALGLAARHHSVLLLDMSFQRPSLERIFGASPLPQGVDDVLLGRRSLAEVICRRNDIDLHLAMLKEPFRAKPKPAILEQMLQAALLLYTWVIVDCAPVREDNRVALRCDAAVLVAEERRTRRRHLAAACRLFPPERTCVLLNRHVYGA